MSSRRNKNKSLRKNTGGSKGDSSPRADDPADPSPATSARTDENNKDIRTPQGDQDSVREFSENSESKQLGESAISSEGAALYNEVVETPKEMVREILEEMGSNENAAATVETDSILPVVPPEQISGEDDTSFFKSFFVCCVGRK
jgi:hypothetical protein